MAAEYNNIDQSTGARSELDEPRRTTEDQIKGDEFGSGVQSEGQRRESGGYGGVREEEQQSRESGGYGGISEDEPPHHKIHSDDEPLPKPAPGTYDEDLPSSESREEQVLPKPTSEEDYGGAPRSTEGYQEHRDREPVKFDESPLASERTGDKPISADYNDPSSAFPGAPVDKKVEERGYGFDQKTSEPVSDTVSPTSETGAAKKEGLITKIKEKLPGHHKTADTTMDHDTALDHDTTGASPKKGFMTKIKEKLPGHHSSTTPPTE